MSGVKRSRKISLNAAEALGSMRFFGFPHAFGIPQNDESAVILNNLLERALGSIVGGGRVLGRKRRYALIRSFSSRAESAAAFPEAILIYVWVRGALNDS